jgi:hypothetical protein
LQLEHSQLQNNLLAYNNPADKEGKKIHITKIVKNRQEFAEISKKRDAMRILGVMDGFYKALKFN